MDDSTTKFDDKNYPFQKETGILIGIAMEIHRILGKGFLEAVYKDAFEYECVKKIIPYEREKDYLVRYKDIILPHKFFADFVVFNAVIIEIKCQRSMTTEHYAQTLNYLAVSRCPVGLLINFSEPTLQFKRLALTK